MTMDVRYRNRVIGNFYFEESIEEFTESIVEFGFKARDKMFKMINPNGISELSISIEPNGQPKISCASYDINSKICEQIERSSRDLLYFELLLKSIAADSETIEDYFKELYSEQMAKNVYILGNSKISENQANMDFKVCSNLFDNAIVSATILKFRRYKYELGKM
jgi:hypothetical protein